jgi:large subunit ribosomal protein L6
MRSAIEKSMDIPSGVECKVEGSKVTVSKSGIELSRTLDINNIKVSFSDNKLILKCNKASKRELKVVNSFFAHISNLIKGLDKKYVYHLEACNVHFPMTLKVDKDRLIINNFLGERVPRSAKIHKGVEIELKSPKIKVSSHDKELAGATASNIEKATKVRARDRRVFQDGIFITSKAEESE